MGAKKNYSTDVFINCPFDETYSPIFHAICFAVHDAGFRARCALEKSDTSSPRIEKIQNLISECKYSIHDLSRVESGSENDPLPRFNMPFECGLFFGAQLFGNKTNQQKQFLVLDSKPHRYQVTMSDIAGQDIGCHSNSPLSAIAKVRQFLNGKEQIGKLPGEALLQSRFKAFMVDLPKIAKELKVSVEELKSLAYWTDMTSAMVAWQRGFH